MRKLIFALLLSVPCFAQSFNPFSSNGSGCKSISSPSYCTKAFTAYSTDPANTNAITQVVVPVPTNYSTKDVHTLVTALNPPRMLMHWQPWWGCSGHPDIGYNENSTSVLTAQLTAMKAVGIDVVVPDYYGNSSAKACNLASVDAMASVIASSPSSYPKMLIGMDQGAWSNSGQCPAGSGITTAQMESCIESQLDYAAVHYLYQSWYETSGGKPIVTFFLDETNWPSVDFDTVWPHVHSHVAQGQSCGSSCTYTAQVLLIGRNSVSIARNGFDGGFAWSPASTYNNASPSTQLLWNGSAGYLDNFYSVCRANTSKLCIGLIYNGFDDSNASFGTNKLISQQAGQVTILTANKVASSGYSSSGTLYGVQFQTWNDMEEGTGLENGINNLFSISSSVVGNVLNWSVTPLDATYSSSTTVDRLRLLYCSGTACNVALDNISYASSGSTSLVTVPTGSWNVYMQMVGKPFMFNQISNASAFSGNPIGITINGGITIKGGIVIK